VREGFGVGDGDLEAIGLDRDAGQDSVDERAAGGLSPAFASWCSVAVITE
jgi:hypothetical protein